MATSTTQALVDHWLEPRRALVALAAGFGVVLGTHIGFQTIFLVLGHDRFATLRALFNVGIERNIPTCYAALLILLNAVLLGHLGRISTARGPAGRAGWWLLGAVFVFLSLDEASPSTRN